MDGKEEIIKEAYETNFGTAYETNKTANRKSPNIRLQDVKDYLNKLEPVQTLNVTNIKVLFPVSLDLLDMGATAKPMRYGLVAVGGFTKVVSVIQIKNKQMNEMIGGLEEVFAIMGTPHQIYTDEEGAMNSNTFNIHK